MYSVKSFDLATLGRYTFDVSGSEVRCIDGAGDFLIQLDEGPVVPFGVGRAFLMPKGESGMPGAFRKITITPDLTQTAPYISGILLIGFAEYKDNRLSIAPNQQIFSQSWARMEGGLLGISSGIATPIATGTPRQVHVRNLDATQVFYFSTSSAQLASAVTNGYRLEPGEQALFSIEGQIYGRSTGSGIFNCQVTNLYHV
jgi:hypothetical protein